MVVLVVGLVLLLPGLALTALGAGAAQAAGDDTGDGFSSTATRLLETETAAVTGGPVELEFGAAPSTWLPERWDEVRLQADSTDGSPVFVGIGPSADVEAWLNGVAHDEVRSTGLTGAVRYDRVDGGREAAAPAGQTFWAASSAGTGTQELIWGLEAGDWTAVVAGTDGAPGVAAEVSVATRAPVLAWGAAGALAGGVPLVVLGLLLLGVGAYARRRPPDLAGRVTRAEVPPSPRVPAPVGSGTAPR